MNNIQKIMLFQYLPAYISKQIQKIKKKIIRKVGNRIIIVENISHFKSNTPPKKRALISLSPEAWIAAIRQYPNILTFNITGLTFEMVRVLNENGYLVDIVDLNEEYFPNKNYNLFIGHGGRCRTIIDNLSPDTKVLQYVSGAYWKSFNQESEERYSAFKERKKIKDKLTFKRSMEGLVAGEEYLTIKADKLFFANCPRMVTSFGKYKNKFYFTGYGSYLDKLLYVQESEKDYKKGRNNFICVSGTGGNIQKGMDILIETFTRTPKLNLYIYCIIEDEILKYYKNELKAKNIRYIYHWRHKIYHKRLKELMKRVNYSVYATINTGISTAFTGSMGLGFIPVGYIDFVAQKESSLISDSWDIDSMVKCVREASSKSPEWCKNASELTRKNYDMNWNVDYFRERFKQLIEEIGRNGKTY